MAASEYGCITVAKTLLLLVRAIYTGNTGGAVITLRGS